MATCADVIVHDHLEFARTVNLPFRNVRATIEPEDWHVAIAYDLEQFKEDHNLTSRTSGRKAYACWVANDSEQAVEARDRLTCQGFRSGVDAEPPIGPVPFWDPRQPLVVVFAIATDGNSAGFASGIRGAGAQ